MFGIGIPVCLPLYQHVFNGLFPTCGDSRSRGIFRGQKYDNKINALNLKTFQSIGGTIYLSKGGVSAGTMPGPTKKMTVTHSSEA
ncbi:hypothetical protein F4809DRAFT_627548 [Biscogniauxia mediterranea]|nr:hypothetical protein F4809DRAFT_627548 [Biscogniauxia mediterranea]